MKLLPSLRQKKRYITVEIVSAQAFLFSDVEQAVLAGLYQFLGELGVSRTGPILVKEKYKNQKFIIKVNHTGVDECKAAMMLVRNIKNIQVSMNSIIVSGSLKKASSYL